MNMILNPVTQQLINDPSYAVPDSVKENVVYKLFKKFPGQLVDVITISTHKKVTAEFIKTFILFPWDYRLIQCRADITLYDIVDNFECDWEFNRISSSDELTIDVVLDHPEVPWDMDFLSKNNNITMELAMEHPELKWNCTFLLYSKSTYPRYERQNNYKKLLMLNTNICIDAIQVILTYLP